LSDSLLRDCLKQGSGLTVTSRGSTLWTIAAFFSRPSEAADDKAPRLAASIFARRLFQAGQGDLGTGHGLVTPGSPKPTEGLDGRRARVLPETVIPDNDHQGFSGKHRKPPSIPPPGTA